MVLPQNDDDMIIFVDSHGKPAPFRTEEEQVGRWRIRREVGEGKGREEGEETVGMQNKHKTM